MSCTRTRALLAEFLHGGLTSADRKEVEVHLQGCAGCRRECAALQQVGHLLDGLPAPASEVDLAQLYRDAAESQQRRLRRWRRIAVTLSIAAAAAVFLAVGFRCEIRLEAHQVVLRWGMPPQDVVPPAPPVPVIEERVATAISPEVEVRLRILSEVVETLAAEGEARDRSLREELVWLKARLQQMRQQAAHRQESTEGDLTALDQVQFHPNRKGEPTP
jgi:hypothetical protein